MVDYKHFANVSVIIPCYNAHKVVKRAVNSVLNQTYKPLEIILVNDCSNDGGKTSKVLNDLAEKSELIKIIELSENKGPGAARNIGWNNASANYVAFLDADDVWHPQKIEIQYNYMKKNKKLVMTGHLTKLNKRFPEGIINYSDKEKVDTLIVKPNKALLSNYFPTRSLMLKRNINFRFDEKKKYMEDYLLILLLILNGYRCELIKLPLGYTFKKEFGESGLSQNLIEMEKGELNNYKIIKDKKLISQSKYYLLIIWSLAKFIRRVLIVIFYNIQSSLRGKF